MWHNMQTKALFQREEGFLFYLVREAAGRAGQKVPHKKVFASSIKRTSRWQPALQSRKSFVRTGIRPFAGCGAGDASGRIFGASWRRLPVIMPYRAYSGLVQPTDTASGQLRRTAPARAAARQAISAWSCGVKWNAVLTQDGKLPCIEIAAAEAPAMPA